MIVKGYSDNEALMDYLQEGSQYTSPALKRIENNLTSYFHSVEYPYNEVKSFLEDNVSNHNLNNRYVSSFVHDKVRTRG